MNPAPRQDATAVNVGMALAMLGVFVADRFTPLGIAVWIVYLIPVVISLWSWKPSLPIYSAALCTGLMLVGYFLSPPSEVGMQVAVINRGFGVFTVWTIALFGRQFVLNKIKVHLNNWLQSGQAELRDRVGGEQSIGQLSDQALAFMAELLDARSGAFFVREQDRFVRTAAYALPADASLPVEFEPGETLAGRVASDAKILVTKDLPPDYFRISSGLGSVLPKHLLIAPATVDGVVYGVFELGFAQLEEDRVVPFATMVSESLAVAIRSAQHRIRLQELLEETQQQAEELQSQSEELRVTNEELEEQSRALKESQSRLEEQQQELELSNGRLEEQRDDLTRAKALLEAQARELEQGSRYKSEFLANMSHELRTPLNSSLILAKLLAENGEGTLTPEQVRYAETIYSSGNDLLRLINEILDLAKIEAGHADLDPAPVKVSQVLEQLRASFEPLAKDKGLSFGIELSPEAPETIFTDSHRLEQILRNLLSNAIKFTEKGEVALVVRQPAPGTIEFAARDTGIGIPPEHQSSIFDAFRQADSTTSRKYGGTGLGLAISRELARRLGGRVTLDSVVGQGSTFRLLLPERYDPVSAAPHPASQEVTRAGAQDESSAPKPSPREAGKRKQRAIEDDRERLSTNRRAILVVEDDEAFARILCDLAREQGFQCIAATSVEEAMAAAAQYRPSAVVLDVGLPDHNGLSVLDMLKQDARTRHIPVHVVSASDYSETAYSLGAVGYMLKPVKREELVDALSRLEDRITRRVRRVLVVEDDAVQMDAVRRLIETGDVETVGASNAAECLEQLQKSTFDCMILDLSLPDGSGISLLDTVSRHDRYQFPPVIVYTGRELTEDEELQLRRYSKSIIIKGAASPERLLDEVTLFLHQVLSELPAEQRKMVETSRSRDAALEGKRILVVEDDVRNVFALTSIFEPRGATVLLARNGREALEVLDSEGGSVDLVLMDIMMPEMDGLTAMREIRKRDAWKKLPIIALTAKAMKNDQEQCLEAGANDYMAKPLDVQRLLSLARVWMPRP